MFATISTFLWFFIPSVILISLGILFEEKLMKFEIIMHRVIYRCVCRIKKKITF